MKAKTMVALFCAGVMCMPLAACGKKDKAPALTADTDFDALVSDKVTEAQWDAAFSNEAFAGATVKYIMKSSSWSTNLLIDFGYQKTNEGYDICFLVTDTDEAMDHDFVAHIAGTQATEYYGEDGVYTYAQGVIEGDSHAAVLNREWMYTFRAYVAYDLVGQFGKFAYDETLHAYTYAGDTLEVKYTPGEAMGSSYTLSEATVKFSGGKLAYAKIKNGEEEEEFLYYDYGKTKVVIPTDAQPDLTESTDFDSLVSEKVTAAQWDAAFTDEAFAGVTVKLTENSNTRLVKYGYERNGDDFSVMKDAEDLSRGSGQNTIYCFKADAVDTYFKFKGNDKPPYCEEGVWYLETHEKDSEGWNGIHSETSMQWGNTFRGLVAYDFAGKFGEFTYDEEQGAYTFTGAMEIKYTPMEAMGEYTVSYAILKFMGGKLAYAKVKVTNGDEEVYNYYDYGKTKVVIPTDAQPMPAE